MLDSSSQISILDRTMKYFTSWNNTEVRQSWVTEESEWYIFPGKTGLLVEAYLTSMVGCCPVFTNIKYLPAILMWCHLLSCYYISASQSQNEDSGPSLSKQLIAVSKASVRLSFTKWPYTLYSLFYHAHFCLMPEIQMSKIHNIK